MKVELSHADLVVLTRAMLRSLDTTPERERAAHEAVYDKLSGAWTRTLPRRTLAAVGRALDRASGR
jgi:hypothetical protein